MTWTKYGGVDTPITKFHSFLFYMNIDIFFFTKLYIINKLLTFAQIGTIL